VEKRIEVNGMDRKDEGWLEAGLVGKRARRRKKNEG
jgi:hypothetical protein